MTLDLAQINEIEAARTERTSTLRPTVPALEEILFQALPVLDHGFIRVVDYLGNDDAVVQARVSPTGGAPARSAKTAGLSCT